jgi:catechol 2,3-dioxygenase-like lactoylglutathione lyase family enzyme
MTETLVAIGPAAYVRDLAAARQFYEDLLGLAVKRVMHRDGREIAVAYTAGLSVWQIDDAYDNIFGRGAERPDRLGCGNASLRRCASCRGDSAPCGFTIPTGTSSISARCIASRNRDAPRGRALYQKP